MRSLALVCLLANTAGAGPLCRVIGQPWLEGRVVASGSVRLPAAVRALDARRGQTVEVYVVARGLRDGRRVTFSDDGSRGHRSWDGCGARVDWRRVEPRPQHTNTAAPNASVPVYANAVVLGPDHGKWIGYDRLEYFESPLDGDATTRLVRDAAPSPANASGRTATATAAAGVTRPERFVGLGVMRLAATVHVGGQSSTTPSADDAPDGLIAPRVFRYSFRAGDDFLGWLTSYFNVPYLFGSAGRGARNQAERYLGADCADLLVAALRRSGVPLDYSSVGDATEGHRPGACRRSLRARLRRLRRAAALVGPHRGAGRGPRPRRQG